MAPLISTELVDSQVKLSVRYLPKLEEWRIMKEIRICLQKL